MPRYTTLAVIPARYGSTRFPAKVLADLHGRPLIEWVWRQAKQASSVDDVWIATDEQRVADAARSFGAHAVMTSPECASGSDRIAQAVADVDVELIVNLQGDEPQMDPRTIDRAVAALRADPEAMVSTARVRLHDPAHFNDPNVVKVVCDQRGRALYFSRSPLPSLARVGENAGQRPALQLAFKHLGLYVYRKPALLAFAKLPQTPLEQIEKLEQLRYLEHGYAIQVIEAEHDSIGIDTPEDLSLLKRHFDPENLP